MSSSSSSSAEISAAAQDHLQFSLHPAVVAPASLTSFLADGCVPLDDVPRVAEKKEAAEAAAAEPANAVVPPVRIIDLSTAVPSEVSVLSAFGMQWAPIVEKAQAASNEVSSASSSSSSGPASAAAPKPPLVTFCSVPSALFQKPSPALLTYEQRLKQLPSALASNAAALKQAEETGELSDVGALHMESKKLQSELSKLQSESPPAKDIVEVRESMQLPLGFVPLDGKMYYLMDSEAGMYKRQAVVAQTHPLGVMQPTIFAPGVKERLLASERISSEIESSILTTLKHKLNLVKLFAPALLPTLTLLWSGAQHGFNAAAFHSRCDNKGATLTVVRSGEYIFGGFNSASWHSIGAYGAQAGCWLFSLSSPTGVLTKLSILHGPYAALNNAGYGPTFGGGHDLHISNTMQSANSNCSNPHSYQVAPGFAGTAFTTATLAGKHTFAVDAIEVFGCA